MQFDVNVNLAASPELLAAINNLAAAFTAESTITRAATRRTPSAKKEDPAGSTLTGAVGGTLTAPPGSAPQAAPQAGTPPAEAPGKSASAEPPPPTESSASAKTTTTTGSVTGAAPSDKTPTVVDVRAALAALVKTDRDRAVALLAKYGAASVSALKSEHYAAVLEEAKQ